VREAQRTDLYLPEPIGDLFKAQVKTGKTREQLVASTDVIKGFEDYGPLVPRPLGPAYDEVTAAG